MLLHIVFFLALSSSFAGSQGRRRRSIFAASDVVHHACAATRYPDVCAAELSAAGRLPPNPTEGDVITAAFSIAAAGIFEAGYRARSILAGAAGNLNRTNAAENCLDLLSLSSRRFAAAAAAFPSAVPDARAWGGAALLYQYDCWSALKYVNSTAEIADAMGYLASLAVLTSNALAMVFAHQRFGSDVSRWRPPQTERDGYWGDGDPSSESVSLPEFISMAATQLSSTVCSDGSCEFATVQAAVDAAPANACDKFVIHIKEGVYNETVRVPFEKKNLAFIGDGMGRTVITGSRYVTSGVSTYNTATVAVAGDGFSASNLTIANTAGPDAHQAVAFLSDSDRSVLESVEFAGHQDTLYAHSLRQYYRRCRISGTVDFIFGNSAALFDSCDILLLPRQLNPSHGESNTVTAHGRTDPSQPTGFVFADCIINGTDEYYRYYDQKPAVHRVYLGRPWKEYSRTVFIDTFMAEVVRLEGWLPWDGSFALATLFYGEYRSTGAGAGNGTSRVKWSSRVPAEHVGVYSAGNFIQGDTWIPPSSLP